MNPEYYDNKNIIKYLKKNFGDVDSISDTNIENFKKNIKSKYNKKQLQEILRKIMLYRFNMKKSPLSNIIGVFYGALIAAVVTFVFTYISFAFNQLNFYADKVLSIKLLEKDLTESNQNGLLEEINKVMTEGAHEIMSLTIIVLLVTFVIAIIAVIGLSFFIKRNMIKINLYEVVIRECIDELDMID